MNNEKFLNAYVEILTTTFHDALNKNIVFQAQAKINGEELENYKQQINNLQEVIEEYKFVQQQIEEKDHELLDKNAELGRLKSEVDQAKSETSHLNTFKNELISARQEIQNKIKEIEELTFSYENQIKKIKLNQEKIVKELKSKIDYLQMTPSQRKKIDAKTVVSTKNVNVEESKDGGTF